MTHLSYYVIIVVAKEGFLMSKSFSLAPLRHGAIAFGQGLQKFAGDRVDKFSRTVSRDFFKNVENIRYYNPNTGDALEINFRKPRAKQKRLASK